MRTIFLVVLQLVPCFVCVCVCVCVCVVIPFILDVRLVDVPAGVTQEETLKSKHVWIFGFWIVSEFSPRPTLSSRAALRLNGRRREPVVYREVCEVILS